MDLDSRRMPNEAFAVTRTIPIGATASGQLERVIDRLEHVDPVAYAKATGKKQLRVRYDASRVGFREIERLLDEVGIARPTGVWWRLRSAWYAFVDQNARGNARSGSGACCNRPPGAGGGNVT